MLSLVEVGEKGLSGLITEDATKFKEINFYLPSAARLISVILGDCCFNGDYKNSFNNFENSNPKNNEEAAKHLRKK